MPTFCPHCGDAFTDPMHTYLCKPEWTEHKTEPVRVHDSVTVPMPPGYRVVNYDPVRQTLHGVSMKELEALAAGAKALTKSEVGNAVINAILECEELRGIRFSIRHVIMEATLKQLFKEQDNADEQQDDRDPYPFRF